LKPLLAFFLLLITVPVQLPETVSTARVVGVTDGDSVKALAAGNQPLRIRLSWIDAPEKGQARAGELKNRYSNDIL
jgi:endonuclease YncB( thermonuclease family)